MSKMQIQFHATTRELFDIVIEMIEKNYYILGFVLFPNFKTIPIKKEITIDEFKSYYGILIAKKEFQIKENYYEFLCEQDNFIGIYIGKETDELLLESTIWASANGNIDSDWRRFINRIKRKMLRGAWIGDSRGKCYYKNAMYSIGAKERFDSGVVIRQFEQSFCYYEFKEKDAFDESLNDLC